MSCLASRRRALLIRVKALTASPLISIMLASLVAVAPATARTAAAGTPCPVWATAVYDNGVYDWGTAYMDCSSASPSVDWVKGELIETFLPLAFTRASCVNNTNTGFRSSCQATYYCNGSGTDEYFMKAMGRDTQGGQSVWTEGPHRNVTC